MTHISKTNRLVSYTIFFLMVFAAAAFADSLVDKHAMNTLKDFQFGQDVSSMDSPPATAAIDRTGDSFLDNSIKAALEDFRFGQSDDMVTAKSSMTHKEGAFYKVGDSFVNMKALNSYQNESNHRHDCGHNC